MLKQLKNIKDLVQKWDLDQVDRERKIEILKIWEENLEKEEFETLIKICSEFRYYSERVTAQAFKEVFNRNASEMDNFSIFIEESLFFPLRKKDEIESAVDMFSSFRLVNKIDVNRTKMICPAEYLEKYKLSIDEHKDQVYKNDQLNKNDEEAIKNLQKQLCMNYNKKIRGKINKRINKLKKIKGNRQERLDKLVKYFIDNYLSVKNIIIIDDFIGTGSSVVSFLKKIGRITENSNINIKLYLWVIEASESGMDLIKETAQDLGIDISISFYRESINVLEENIIFSPKHINNVREMIRKINIRNHLRPSDFCKNHAIASFVNAPNNNLTILSEQSVSWTALFLRTKRNKVKREISKLELKDAYEFLRN